MSTALLDRPVAPQRAGCRNVSQLDTRLAPELASVGGDAGKCTPVEVAADVDLDLQGMDYFARRRRLIAALRRLRTNERLRVTSTRADDVHWLRYELEARLDGRYRWRLSSEDRQAAVHTVTRLDS